jgi:hypothetical protein
MLEKNDFEVIGEAEDGMNALCDTKNLNQILLPWI